MFFELKHHGPQLKRIVDDQHARLREAQEKLLKVEEKQSGLEERINHAIQVHNLLEKRLERLRNLPGAHKKPLSRAEREFKSELGNKYYACYNCFVYTYLLLPLIKNHFILTIIFFFFSYSLLYFTFIIHQNISSVV